MKTNYDKYMKTKEEKHFKNNNLRENYSLAQSSGAGISAAFDSFLLVIAIIFFILEFLLLFYSISLALKCTSPGPERILHLTLAITFTLPYALFSAFFSKCSQDTLKNSDIFLAPKTGGFRPSNLSGSTMSFV